jgi:hypothetical protein
LEADLFRKTARSQSELAENIRDFVLAAEAAALCHGRPLNFMRAARSRCLND